MNFVSILLFPLSLLSPAMDLGVVDPDADDVVRREAALSVPDRESGLFENGQWPAPATIALPNAGPLDVLGGQGIAPQNAWQIRIEGRMTIRITPRGAAPEAPNMPDRLSREPLASRFIERPMGRCLSASAISGVQPQQGNRLLLFMRGGGIVAADLERACQARDFYSGFYVPNSSDGNLCVGRDQLLTRSGANCKLTQIRQLIQDRR